CGRSRGGAEATGVLQGPHDRARPMRRQYRHPSACQRVGARVGARGPAHSAPHRLGGPAGPACPGCPSAGGGRGPHRRGLSSAYLFRSAGQGCAAGARYRDARSRPLERHGKVPQGRRICGGGANQSRRYTLMEGSLPQRAATLAMLRQLERKVLWLSSYMIHHANHEVDRGDGLKVGGHQASSASLVTLMTALYFHVLHPEDRVAVKPHASPVFHAIQYLLGNQTLDKLQTFRAFGGAQSYPSRTKDKADVDFSTGSVGLGLAEIGLGSVVQDYAHAKGWHTTWPKGRMIGIMGAAEIDEGNGHAALLESWKHGLQNCWWIIDYNRQSLDSVVSDRLFMKM